MGDTNIKPGVDRDEDGLTYWHTKKIHINRGASLWGCWLTEHIINIQGRFQDFAYGEGKPKKVVGRVVWTTKKKKLFFSMIKKKIIEPHET